MTFLILYLTEGLLTVSEINHIQILTLPITLTMSLMSPLCLRILKRFIMTVGGNIPTSHIHPSSESSLHFQTHLLLSHDTLAPYSPISTPGSFVPTSRIHNHFLKTPQAPCLLAFTYFVPHLGIFPPTQPFTATKFNNSLRPVIDAIILSKISNSK